MYRRPAYEIRRTISTYNEMPELININYLFFHFCPPQMHRRRGPLRPPRTQHHPPHQGLTTRCTRVQHQRPATSPCLSSLVMEPSPTPAQPGQGMRAPLNLWMCHLRGRITIGKISIYIYIYLNLIYSSKLESLIALAPPPQYKNNFCARIGYLCKSCAEQIY